MEDSFEKRHEWEDYVISWPLGTLEETGLTMPKPVSSSCPFGFLWDN